MYAFVVFVLKVCINLWKILTSVDIV